MGRARRQPGRPARWQQTDPVRQLYAHAARLGEQQLVTAMPVQARVMPTQIGGDAADVASQLIGIERVIGKNKGHLSDS
ncbi:hypothetical protein D3C85_1758560 [compost metagenome]